MGPNDAGERGQRACILKARDDRRNYGMADDVGGGVLIDREAQVLSDPVLDGTASAAHVEQA